MSDDLLLLEKTATDVTDIVGKVISYVTCEPEEALNYLSSLGGVAHNVWTMIHNFKAANAVQCLMEIITNSTVPYNLEKVEELLIRSCVSAHCQQEVKNFCETKNAGVLGNGAIAECRTEAVLEAVRSEYESKATTAYSLGIALSTVTVICQVYSIRKVYYELREATFVVEKSAEELKALKQRVDELEKMASKLSDLMCKYENGTDVSQKNLRMIEKLTYDIIDDKAEILGKLNKVECKVSNRITTLGACVDSQVMAAITSSVQGCTNIAQVSALGAVGNPFLVGAYVCVTGLLFITAGMNTAAAITSHQTMTGLKKQLEIVLGLQEALEKIAVLVRHARNYKCSESD